MDQLGRAYRRSSEPFWRRSPQVNIGTIATDSMGEFVKNTFGLALVSMALLLVSAGASLAQGANAQMVADRVLQNPAALKSACPQGQAGITPLVRQAVGDLMREGKQLNPAVDGPAAGQILAVRCQTM